MGLVHNMEVAIIVYVECHEVNNIKISFYNRQNHVILLWNAIIYVFITVAIITEFLLLANTECLSLVITAYCIGTLLQEHKVLARASDLVQKGVNNNNNKKNPTMIIRVMNSM